VAWLRDRPKVVFAFRKGERAALSAVYRQYVSDVLRLFRIGFTTRGTPPVRVAGLPDPGDQMDGAQEVFVRAFSEPARMSYDGLRPYGSYLRRIGQNYRIDQLRRSGREIIDDELVDSAPAAEEDPIETRHWNTLSQATAEYLEGLDSMSREFVRLRFEEEGSQDTVADAMGITRRRVRTLEGRVTRGLRKHLKHAGVWTDSEKSADSEQTLVGAT
jgi:RNA polymerase sigma factor (sigma-70 family)